MPLASDWVARVRRHLLAYHQDPLTLLDVGIDNAALTFTLRNVTGLSAGYRIEIDNELMLVTDVNSSSRAIAVLRGDDGSTAAAHSAGAVVRINPRFPAVAIIAALNDALSELSGALWATKSITVAVTDVGLGYDAAADLQDVLAVELKPTGSLYEHRLESWEVRHGQNLAEFPSGIAIWFRYAAAGAARVTYKADFTPIVDATTDTATVGLPATSYDLPPLGAALVLLAGRGVKRAFTESQPDTRNSAEVVPGAYGPGTAALQKLYDRRLTTEVQGLHQKWKTRRKRPERSRLANRTSRWGW